MRNSKVCVIGDAFIDITVPVESIANIAVSGVISGKISFSYGGTANIAYWIAQKGVDAKFFGKVGSDDLGKLFRNDLQKNNIEDLILFDDAHNTGICLSLVSRTGERSMIVNRGANDFVYLEDAKKNIEKIMKDTKILFFSGYSFISPITANAINFLMVEGKNRGIEIWYNPGAWNIINDRIYDKLSHIIDFIILNFDEAKIISKIKSKNVERIIKKLSLKYKNVILTMGKEGCIVALDDDDRIVHIPSKRVSKVVDTTGAGDAFAGGLIAGYMKGYSIEEACILGHECASVVIQKFGTR